LAQTHRLPGMNGMFNRRFWQNDFQVSRSVKVTRSTAERLLAIVEPAMEHLQACKKEATVNAELLDAFLHGAGRMERIGRRMLDGLKAAEAYTAACETTDLPKRLTLLAEVERLVDENRKAHAELGQEFERIWLSESKPFALDQTLERYANLDTWYADLAARVADARAKAEAGEDLPAPETLGLALPSVFSRRTRPHKVASEPLGPDVPWAEPEATHRLGLAIGAGSVDRHELPIEVAVSLPSDLASKPIRAFCSIDGRDAEEILAQLDPAEKAGTTRLTLIVPGPIAKQTTATVHVYLGRSTPPELPAGSVSTADGDGGMVALENDKVRLVLGPEGAHVYRWEVKAAENRDLTLPGETGYCGFSDTREGRGVPHTLTCTARGPALVRYLCTDANGTNKAISLFGGASWMEVTLDAPVDYYWDFDNPENFAGDGPTPGTYLFANGETGPVGKMADGIPSQVKAGGVRWAVKFSDEELALGMTTPESAANFVVAPGDNAGGVGIEASPRADHFVTFAGQLEHTPAETMTRLQQTLDFKNQPVVVVYAVQGRP